MPEQERDAAPAPVGPAEMIRLARLLDEVLGLPDASAQQRWLDALPIEHAPLLPHLRRMLAAQGARITALDGGVPLARMPAPLPVSSLSAGDRIGPYVLERELGQGGMSEVWLARRADDAAAEPVALKLPAVSLGSTGFLERLARERTLLERLDHPNIARLVDAGVDAHGQHYLALTYVDGLPLDRYCDERSLGLDARLALVGQVLDALQCAHERSVLHRDLKPSNILVTAAGEARLLDFGIAKLLVDGRAHETELTERWGRALTPAYASPEQRVGGPVTVRSDLYAVGVILYELVAGARPQRGPEDAPELPPPPSRALAADSAIARAEGGGGRLRRRLTGDLDDVVLQALQPDALRRQADARTLAAQLAAVRAGRALQTPSRRWWRATRAVMHRQRLAMALVVPAWLVWSAWPATHHSTAQLEAWLMPPLPAEQRVILVTIGRPDHERLFGGRSPLDAEVLRRLLERILEGGPAVVGVDLDTSAAHFAPLRDAFDAAALQRIVWARDVEVPAEGAPLSTPRAVLGAREAGAPLHSGLALTLASSSDGTLRWYARAIETAAGPWPTLGPMVAARATRAGGDADHPRDTVARNIGFGTAERSELPASVVLAPGFTWGERIRNRAVLLGGRYDAADQHPTPLGVYAGVEVLAQIVETEVAGRGYPRPGIGTRALVGLWSAAVSIALVDRFGAGRGAVAACGVIALTTALLAWTGTFEGWAYGALSMLLVVPVAAGALVHARAARRSSVVR